MNLEADGLARRRRSRAHAAAAAAAAAKILPAGLKDAGADRRRRAVKPGVASRAMTTDRRLSREKTTRELTADGSAPSRASLSRRHSWPNSPASNQPNGVKPEVSFRRTSSGRVPPAPAATTRPPSRRRRGPRSPAAVSGTPPAAGPNVEWTDRLMEAVAWPFNKFFDEAGADAPPTRENSNFNPLAHDARAGDAAAAPAPRASSKRTISCREVGGARGCTFEMDGPGRWREARSRRRPSRHRGGRAHDVRRRLPPRRRSSRSRSPPSPAMATTATSSSCR